MQGRLSGQILLKLAAGMADFGRYTKLASDEWGSWRSVGEGAAMASQTAWKQVELLQQRLGLIGSEVGKTTLPVFKSLVSVMNHLTDQVLMFVQTTSPAWERWSKTIAGKMEVFKTAFTGFGEWTAVAKSYILEFAQNSLTILTNLGKSIYQMFTEVFTSIGNLLSNIMTESIGRSVSNTLTMTQAYIDSIWATIPFKNMFGKDPNAKATAIMAKAQAAVASNQMEKGALLQGVRAPNFKGFGAAALGAGMVDRGDERKAPLEAINRFALGNQLVEGAGKVKVPEAAKPFLNLGLQAAMGKIPPNHFGRGFRGKMLAKQHDRRLARLASDAERRKRAAAKLGKLSRLSAKPRVGLGLASFTAGGEAKDAGKSTGLTEFAKSLQEAVFGGSKQDALVEATEGNADATQKNNAVVAHNTEQLRRLADGGLKVKFA